MAAWSTTFETFQSGTPRRPGVARKAGHSINAWSKNYETFQSGTPRRPGVRTRIRRPSLSTTRLSREELSTAWSNNYDTVRRGTPRRPGISRPPIVTSGRWLQQCVLPYLAGETYSCTRSLSSGSDVSVRLAVSDDGTSFELQLVDGSEQQKIKGEIIPPPAVQETRATATKAMYLPADLCLRLDSIGGIPAAAAQRDFVRTRPKWWSVPSLRRSNVSASSKGPSISAASTDSSLHRNIFEDTQAGHLGVTIQNHAGSSLRIGDYLLHREVNLASAARL